MRTITFLLAVLAASVSPAQTGPAGVGNGASNMLWLSADNGVTVAGAAVITWNDRSGNGNNAASPSVAARPILTGSALNGYPVLAFDGTNSELRIPDANSLDLQQWDVFFVGAENVAKNNNAWLSKGSSLLPNYAVWSPISNALQLAIFDIFGLLSSPLTPANATGLTYNVLDYNNTVIFGFLPSRTVYKNGTSIYTDVNLLQLPLTNNSQLYIGNVQGTAGWNLNGGLAEVIMYNGPVNSAQRLIINNYLAAKYGLALTANDVYLQDNFPNGNYDHEVAGIGRISATSFQTDSRGSAVVRINNASGLGNNEFLIWGHDNGVLGSWGSTDFPPGLQGRWFRVWRVNEVSPTGVAVDVGNVDITFDLTGQGPVTASDLRLLVDLNNNGIFADDAPVAIAATSLGGNLYRFAGVNALVNNRRFTLATINIGQTPLPIELLYFDAEAQDRIVNLTWGTASELNNDHFTVERSADASTWEKVIEVPGAGTSNVPLSYEAQDLFPLPGLSYYRLRQTDSDGSCTYSKTVAVRLELLSDLLVYPDPAQDLVNVVFTASGRYEVQLMNDMGQLLRVPMTVMEGHARLDVSAVPAGCYLVAVITEQAAITRRLIVSR